MPALLKLLPSLIVAAVFGLDRVTKHAVTVHMFSGESIPVLPFFHLTYIHNTGIAFGIGQNQNRIFTFMAGALLIALLVLRHRWEKKYGADLKLRAGIALVIGGALGNLYDRIVFGSVIDFLDFFAGGWHWPAFNVADAAICIGAGLLIVSQWKEKPVTSETPSTSQTS